MSDKLQRLELVWPGKNERVDIEPRILIEDVEKSYLADPEIQEKMNRQLFKQEPEIAPTFNNMLIHGDNLLALKALEAEYSGKVKCIYIDPSYNTGNAFEHYDDGYSSEKNFIFTTTMNVEEQLLAKISQALGDGNLLVYCGAFTGNKIAYDNITVKKIPQAILKKCQWGSAGYPLPIREDFSDEDFEFEDEE